MEPAAARQLLDTFDPAAIADPSLRAACVALMSLVEHLLAENASQRQEIQRLHDEIRRLKGEHGRPTPSGRAPVQPVAPDRSSEAERRTRKPRQKAAKLPLLAITRTVLLPPPADLPPDAIFKGTERVVVQDLLLRTEVICFEKPVFYAPSTGRSYRAVVPPGYEGAFGPGIKTFVLAQNHECHVTFRLIHRCLQQVGISISRGEVSHLATAGADRFQAEARAVLAAGLASSPWQHLDSTGTKVNGQPGACHVLSNPLFTYYHTTPGQDRQSVLDVLRGGAPRQYRLDGVAFALLAEHPVPVRVLRALAALPGDTTWSEVEFAVRLDQLGPRLGVQARKWIRDAAAVAAYRADPDWPVVQCLVCDDASVFRGLTPEVALCWIHDGRHYKTLVPQFTCYRRALARFRKQYWAFYRELLAYRDAPTPREAVRLEARFDRLFSTETLYAELNRCIRRTRENKAKLLRVLIHPELPLHNNPAELAARRRVRKRDASFGPRSEAGRRAWDTCQSLAATTAQLGIRFWEYLHDRITQAGKIPPLAEVIAARAPQLRLGYSWDTS